MADKVATALFIVWVCNADTFDAAQAPDTLAQWQAANTKSQANHQQIIAKLYAKGVRNLVLPNAVDISKIPAFNAGTTYTSVERAGCLDYNLKLSNTISQARSLYRDLKIYTPDYFYPAEQRADKCRRLLWFDQCPVCQRIQH